VAARLGLSQRAPNQTESMIQEGNGPSVTGDIRS
jgi:hypothetical protein